MGKDVLLIYYEIFMTLIMYDDLIFEKKLHQLLNSFKRKEV